MIHFYGYFRSSASYRCRIAFNLKGIEHDFTSVHLRRNGGEQHAPSFKAMNPQGLVPSITEGDFQLNQSLAIIEWLDETHPEPALLPTTPNARAQVRAFAQMIACDIHPLQNLRILLYLKHELGLDDAAKDAWLERWLGDGLAACDAVIAREGKGSTFCFGETPGLADICLVPQVFSALRFNVDMSNMPHVTRVYEVCQALPAFADAAPDKQADAA